MNNYINKKDNFNNLFKINKFDSSKYDPNFNSKDKIKRLDHHECIFDHIDATVRPSETRTVRATFSGVVYSETTIKNIDIRFVLNEAIEKFLQYGHLGQIKESAFVDFVNEKFNVHLISVDSIDLSVVRALKQEPSKPMHQEQEQRGM